MNLFLPKGNYFLIPKANQMNILITLLLRGMNITVKQLNLAAVNFSFLVKFE